MKKVVVFGGRGFLGSKIVERLGVNGISASRRDGQDCLDPSSYETLLKEAHAVVVSVGSPPLPFVDYQKQFDANGTTNITVLETAKRCGVKRAILVNATMPEWAPAGYRDGKIAAEKAAKELFDGAAVVLKPSALYGTRYENGIPIPLTPILGPVAWLLRTVKPDPLVNALPYLLRGALVPPVSVDAVAKAAADAALLDTEDSYTELGPDDLVL